MSFVRGALAIVLWLIAANMLHGVLVEGQGNVIDLALALLVIWGGKAAWPSKREPKPVRGRHRAGAR